MIKGPRAAGGGGGCKDPEARTRKTVSGSRCRPVL